MNWVDAMKIGAVVVASLGGGGGIVLGFSRFIGDKWLQDWKGDIDARLQRLDAALQHRNYVLQRLAEFELEAITECWRAARACLPLINATRPLDSGTDEDTLGARYKDLSDGHNKLIETLGRHELFLSPAAIDTLDAIGRVVRMEMSNIRYDEHFKGSWWEDGKKNRDEFKALCDELLRQSKDRAGELRADSTTHEA
ncbi:MAG: hypothetical protein A3H96_02480 [Acidobacteria bacterium RIFCSPLOWO2_02_FULL_67_36]|nr:MAG: hypothetical protein A3H96_02480 [Acidobacteria bacterium RIFCSPLOWO2_02_FULL_67_36]